MEENERKHEPHHHEHHAAKHHEPKPLHHPKEEKKHVATKTHKKSGEGFGGSKYLGLAAVIQVVLLLFISIQISNLDDALGSVQDVDLEEIQEAIDQLNLLKQEQGITVSASNKIDSVVDSLETTVVKLEAKVHEEPKPEPSPTAPSAPSVDMTDLIDDDTIKGDPDAPVTIVEFSDFECPFCARFYSQTLKQIESEYIDTGKVKLVYRDLPLSFHPNAQKAAEAAECAGEQDDYWGMHDILFEQGVSGGVPSYKAYAAQLGLDTAEFNECLDSGAMAAEVRKDAADAQRAGVQGTPGFVINGHVLSGAQPFPAFQQAIEAALNGEAPAAPTPTPPSAPAPTPTIDMEGLEDDDTIKGDPDAPVLIVEFSDFECPFCERFYSQTLSQIESEYIDTGKAKLVYRDLPLSFHPNAQKAAEAAECAGEQDDYWGMHDLLFEQGASGGVASYKAYAVELGLNTVEFDECLDSGAMAGEVRKDAADAQRVGVQGTPGFVIDGQVISGAQPFGVFAAAIDAALAK